MSIDKKNIRSLNLEELKNFFIEQREQPFRGKQVYEWLWKKSARNFNEMSNLSKAIKKLLLDRENN